MGDDFADNPNVSATYLADKYNEYSIQIIRWILKSINAWPRPDDVSIVEKIGSDFATFTCYFLMVAIVVPNAMSMLFDSQQSYESKLLNIGPLTFCSSAIVKYFFFLRHLDDIHNCVEHVKTDWLIIRRFEDQRLMLKSAKLGRNIAGFCAVFMQCVVFSYNVIQSIPKTILHVENSSIMVRTLPYPFYSNILDAHFSPAYELVYLLQCLSSIVISSVTAASYALSAVFVMHACGQMRVMTSWLENLVDGRNEEKTSVKERFAIIVKHHLRILSLVSRIEKIMSMIYFVEIVGSTLSICLLGYYCLMDFIVGNHQSILSHMMILSSITSNIFIFCYIGEKLSEQGEQIGKSVYMTDWYLLPGKTAQGLILMILRSNADLKLTAGNMIDLSFSTFSDVMKTSLAYLNLLRTVLTT